MAQARTLVGLDVHAQKIVAAVLDAETGELRSVGLPGCSLEAARFCSELPAPVRATCEAGPTGYGLARALARPKLECVVAAPGKLPRVAGDRVKTDRRDAEHLARLLLAGELCPVRVPGEAEEALRDLVRAREDLRGDLMRARHRLSKLLLRHGVRYEGRSWTERHRAWLARLSSLSGPRRRPSPTTAARSKPCFTVAPSSSGGSRLRFPARRASGRWRGFAACAHRHAVGGRARLRGL